MVVNETRKRLLRQLNSRYIFGKYVRPSPGTGTDTGEGDSGAGVS